MGKNAVKAYGMENPQFADVREVVKALIGLVRSLYAVIESGHLVQADIGDRLTTQQRITTPANSSKQMAPLYRGEVAEAPWLVDRPVAVLLQSYLEWRFSNICLWITNSDRPLETLLHCLDSQEYTIQSFFF